MREGGEEFVLHSIRGLGIGPCRLGRFQEPVAFLTGTLLGGDISSDLRGPDDLARSVRIGETVSETSMIVPVLPPPLGLVVVHLLAAADAGEDRLDVLDEVGRQSMETCLPMTSSAV